MGQVGQGPRRRKRPERQYNDRKPQLRPCAGRSEAIRRPVRSGRSARPLRIESLARKRRVQRCSARMVAFRRHTLPPLDDCLSAARLSILHLKNSVLHRGLWHHGISRRPDSDGVKPKRQKFKRRPIDFLHIDIAEARSEEGKRCLLLAIDRTIEEALVKRHHDDSHDPAQPSWRLS